MWGYSGFLAYPSLVLLVLLMAQVIFGRFDYTRLQKVNFISFLLILYLFPGNRQYHVKQNQLSSWEKQNLHSTQECPWHSLWHQPLCWCCLLPVERWVGHSSMTLSFTNPKRIYFSPFHTLSIDAIIMVMDYKLLLHYLAKAVWWRGAMERKGMLLICLEKT